MLDKEKLQKYGIYGIAIFVLCLILVFVKLFFDIIGNPTRADEIYTQALKDLKEQNYSNAYYQFSKVSYLSDLKPYAIYHRAECAKALEDFKSEQKQYYILFNIFPKNELALRAKYLFAIDTTEENPKYAQKLFEEIISASPQSNYALGAKYHLANLLYNKYKDATTSPFFEREEIINYLREYLRVSPNGRWALKAVELWLKTTDNIIDEDKLLLAETYCLYNLPQKAEAILVGTDFNTTWAKQAQIALIFGEKGRAKALIESGLKQQNSKVKENEKNEIINKYLSTNKNKEKIATDFAQALGSKNDIYVKSQKCKYTQNDKNKSICYSNILKTTPTKILPENILFDIFFDNLTNNHYSNAKNLALEYIKRFPTGQNADLATYWVGNIYLHEGKKTEANEYFKKVILNYPDSYYAFRSYLKTNKISNSIITTQIEPQDILFPYLGKADAKIIKLVEMKDYDILSFIYENDKFIQSWILFEKGEKSRAMCMARDAMAKLTQKPDKTDLRWRLVYPTFMYETMKNYAQEADTNPVLMLALTREESYFNENANSYVGAVGLMQIMPSTAKEINRIKNLGMKSLDELKNPYVNLRLGNHYYKFVLNGLNNNNILTVAAYNGGIGSISRWKKGLEYRDIDEFIEKIPYTETRVYVKKVFRTYWNYARLYL